MSSPWDYLIPSLAEAPPELKERGSRYSLDIEIPRVSVFCIGGPLMEVGGGREERWSHESEPWLFGSFEPNVDWFEQTGQLNWAFHAHYPTGDGYSLRLGVTAKRHLVADRLLTQADASRVAREDPPGFRAHYEFRCRRSSCSASARWTADSIQTAVSALHQLGQREVSLGGFRDLVGRTRRLST